LALILGLEELDYTRLRALFTLYQRSPELHCYLVYDVIYKRDSIDLVTLFEDDQVLGYALLWTGYDITAIHLWGKWERLLPLLELRRPASLLYIHLYDWSKEDAEAAKAFAEKHGYSVIEENIYLDMVLREEWFKPFILSKVARLRPIHAALFAAAQQARGLQITEEEAKRLLEEQRCYGIIDEGRIVSVACRYLMLPEIGCIGGVYTEPLYRGRGYAREVTSAISSDIVSSGATAMLHVERGNTPAIRVYRRLGYRVAGQKLWIIARPG
jgi:ribosomal protein S18 acetylase RimI-like enzyme